MSKRNADSENGTPLKGGSRPDGMDIDDKEDRDMGEFEDEFEDEFESEDEIFEAGVDGRPDVEREADEKSKLEQLLLIQCCLADRLLCLRRHGS